MIVLCYMYYYIFRVYKRTFKLSNFTYQFFFIMWILTLLLQFWIIILTGILKLREKLPYWIKQFKLFVKCKTKNIDYLMSHSGFGAKLDQLSSKHKSNFFLSEWYLLGMLRIIEVYYSLKMSPAPLLQWLSISFKGLFF